ncbi:MAG: hypothetical protein WKG06_34600 [Segetibacter sp.]
MIKSRADVQENDLIAGKTLGTDNWGAEPDKGFLHTEKDNQIIKEFIVRSSRKLYGVF